MVAREQQQWTLPPVTSVQRPNSLATSVMSGEKLKQLYRLMVALRAHRKIKGIGKGVLQFREACEAAAVIDLEQGDTVALLPGQHLVHAPWTGPGDRTDCNSTVPAWKALELAGHDRLPIAAGVAFAHR